MVNQIVGDISDCLSQHVGDEVHGMVFVKNVSDAYELGTKQSQPSLVSLFYFVLKVQNFVNIMHLRFLALSTTKKTIPVHLRCIY